MPWPEILNHPFVKGHILISSSEDGACMPLTRPMSSNTLQIKEQQKKEHLTQKKSTRYVFLQTQSSVLYSALFYRSMKVDASELDNMAKAKSSKHSKTSVNSSNQDSCGSKTVVTKDMRNNNTPNLEGNFKNLSLDKTTQERLLENETEFDESNAEKNCGKMQEIDRHNSDLEEKKKENINEKKGKSKNC